MEITIDMLATLSAAQLERLRSEEVEDGVGGRRTPKLGNRKLRAEKILEAKGITWPELKWIAGEKGLSKGGGRDDVIARIWPEDAADEALVADFEEMTEEEAASIFQSMTRTDIDLSNLYLDPANPRFFLQKNNLEDSEIITVENQKHSEDQIEAEGGTSDLDTKMMKFGFVDHENLYVRDIGDGKYVVLEGNRRTRAAKNVKEMYIDLGAGIENKTEQWKESFNSITCQVYDGERDDIAWIIQGFRHNGGVMDWHPVRRAKFFKMRMVADQKTAQQIGDDMGIPGGVGADVTSYEMLQSANSILVPSKRFPEAQSEKSFGWFKEGVNKSPRLRKWLGWDADDKEFKKKDNVKRFRDMILKDPPQFPGHHRLATLSKKLLKEDGTPTEYWETMVDDDSCTLEEANNQRTAADARRIAAAEVQARTLSTQIDLWRSAVDHLNSPVTGGEDSIATIGPDLEILTGILDAMDSGISNVRRQIAIQFPPNDDDDANGN